MRNQLATTLAIAAAIMLGTSTPAKAQDACDASSFKGAFGYSLKGHVYDNRGYNYFLGAAGRLIADGSGAITGADAISYDGSIVKRKFTGTYTVNEDCTGSLVLNADDSSITNADFVIVNDGKEVSLVQTDPNFILTGELKLQKSAALTPSPTASAR